MTASGQKKESVRRELKRLIHIESLLKSGAVVAFGTDWPVAPLNPLYGIYAAVTRQTVDGKNPVWLDSRRKNFC
ncbi:MAG: amidohydrolase family protein [Ignavibacteriales bacterium]|nr:amidohydrolase family protein [Ignavibacteriales bacterium]